MQFSQFIVIMTGRKTLRIIYYFDSNTGLIVILEVN